MDISLKEELIYSMLRFKKVGMTLPPEMDIRIGELFVLNGVAQNFDCSHKSVHVSDLHGEGHFTKPAVSQILNSLEKKGYVTREMDKADRRKIAVSLTESGSRILKQAKDYTDQSIEKLITRFGEQNTKQLIELFKLLADISESIKNENLPDSKEGEEIG